MRCFEVRFLKFVFVGAIVFGCFSSCALFTEITEKKQLKNILSSFVGKTPNQLYATLGKPDKYKVVLNKKQEIANAIATYQYIFNFSTRQYECNVDFITDKTQKKIVDYQYNSVKCFYITMY